MASRSGLARMVRISVFISVLLVASGASGQFIKPALPPALPDAAQDSPSRQSNSPTKNVKLEELSDGNPLRRDRQVTSSASGAVRPVSYEVPMPAYGHTPAQVARPGTAARSSKAMRAVANIPEPRASEDRVKSTVEEGPVESIALSGNRPPTVQHFHQAKLWNMKLGEALYIALNNNKQLKIQQIQPEIFKTLITEEFARF
ncbi:MAG: hypothetical protein AAF497_13410, partial [Planctomycetota bacterium]